VVVSQLDALRGLDAMILADLKRMDLVDTGTYTAPGGGTPVACDVLVDRNVKDFGDDQAPVATLHVVVGIFREQVATPARGGVVTVGAESWRLDAKIDQDESLTRWVVMA
jgi:hypothetical protein